MPFGEIFVGPLIEHTANFTVAAVRAVGIPVLRNGTRFELPTGSWSVVEACAACVGCGWSSGPVVISPA